MTKKACFRLTIRNVNSKRAVKNAKEKDSFRLTIRNVNKKECNKTKVQSKVLD